MANNSRNLLSLIDECNDHELNVSLELLRSELACWDKNLSWLPLLESQLDLYKDVGILNLYDKIRMLVELRKLTPKILQLQNDLTANIKSLRNLCNTHQFDFKSSLSQNLLQHSANCAINNPNLVLVKPTQNTPEKRIKPNEQPSTVNDLEEKFYPRHIVKMVRSYDHCETCTVRVAPDGIAWCLLCNFQAPPNHVGHLQQHVAGKGHLKRVEDNRTNLKKHWEFWKGAKREHQERQFQFKFVNGYSVQCVVCNAKVTMRNVCKHLDRCSSDGSSMSTVAAPAQATYHQRTKTTIFSDVPYIDIKGEEYPVFQRFDNTLFCLVCNKSVTCAIEEHVSGSIHDANVNSELVWNTFKMYHDIWMSLPERLQTQQVYFRRRTTRMNCMACSAPIEYKARVARDHVESKTHEKYVAMMVLRDSKGKSSNASVGAVISYSGSSNSSDSFSNNNSEICQSSSSSTLEVIENNKTDSPRTSRSSPLENPNRTTLAEVSLSGLSQLNLQELVSSLVQLQTKIKSTADNFNDFVVANRDDNGTPERVSAWNNEEDACALEAGTPNGEIKAIEDLAENHSTVTTLPTMPAKKPRTPSQKKLNDAKSTPERKTPTPSNSIPKNPQFPPYGKSLTDDLYPDGLLHYNVTVGNIKYPIIQNVGPYKHCLVCAENVSSVLFHLNSAKHVTNAKHEINRKLLKSYHDVFLQLPVELQFEQQHFRKELRLLCVLCDKKVRYDAGELLEHVRSTEHKNSELQLENPDIEESDFEVPIENIKDEVLSPWGSPSRQATSPVILKTESPIKKNTSPAKVKTERVSSPANARLGYLVATDNAVNGVVCPAENLPQSRASPVKVKSEKACSPAKTKGETISDYIQYEAILHQIYPPDLSKAVREREGFQLTYDTYQAQKGWPTTQYRCLVCDRGFGRSDLISHVSTKAHRKRAMKVGRLKSIEIYHFRWNTMSPRHKVLQQDFSPVNASLTFCKSCCLNVKYGELGNHLEKYHLSETEYSLKDKLTSDFSYKSDINYAPEVQESLYRNNESLCNLIVLNTSYPLIQTGAVVMRCLLCRQDIAYDKRGFRNPADMDNVRTHLDSDQHRKNMCDFEVKRHFREYHDAWMSFKPDVQRQQLLFFGDGDSLFCTLCGCSVKTAKIGRHVAENPRHHNLEFDEFGTLIDKAGESSPRTKAAKQQALQQHLGVGVEGSEYGDSNSDSSELNGVSDDLATRLVFESKPKKGPLDKPTTIIRNGYVTVEEAVDSSKLAEEIPNEAKKHLSIYPKGVLNRIYADLHQYTITIDRVVYPVFRRTMLGLLCIVCGDKPVLHADDHLKTLPHLQACDDGTGRLKQFHKFWSKQNEATQHEQIFVVNDECVLCHKTIPFENVRAHVKSKPHENRAAIASNEALHQALGLKFQYSADAQVALYMSVPSQEAIEFDGEVYPVLRTSEQGTRCVVCNDVFVKSVKEHFATGSHRDLLRDRANLQRVAKFHRFWMAQEPVLQMEQRFVVQGKCVLCEKAAADDGVVAHIKSKGHLFRTQQVKKKEKDRVENAKKHNIKDSISNPKAAHIIKQLPVYLSGHLSHLKWDDEKPDEVTCTKCKKTCHTGHELRLHVDSQPHVNATQVPRKQLKFYCELCRKWYPCETTWNIHLVDPVHIEQSSKVGPVRQAKLKENLCITCATVFFGDAMSIVRHVRGGANGTDEPRVTLSKYVKQLFASREFIVEEAQRLLRLATEAAKDQAKEERCCTALVKALKETYPNCEAYPFGSRVTVLGYDDSDLDVFLDIGKMYDGKRLQGPAAQADIVHTVAAMLQRNRPLFMDINKVPHARTPIVQVYHAETGIDCDISFRHGLSVENTAFVSFCLDLQPSIRAAMLYLKEWYAKSEMPTGVTSYALIMMLVYYLQTEGYLFSVARVRELNGAKGPVINGWETVKYTKPLASLKVQLPDCTMSVLELLTKFFSFYATFDFETLVICPLLGRPIAKTDFQVRHVKLPEEMSTYVKKLSMPNPEVFRMTAMCVQDPFDLSHNLTKACSATFLKTFKKYCALTKAHIDAFE